MIPTTHHAPLYTPRPPAQVQCSECGCIIDPVIGWCAQCDRESHPGDTPDHDPRDLGCPYCTTRCTASEPAECSGAYR